MRREYEYIRLHVQSKPGIEGQEELPVIFATAEGDVEMVAKGAAEGGVDYVTKPVQHDLLLALVKSRLRHQRPMP